MTLAVDPSLPTWGTLCRRALLAGGLKALAFVMVLAYIPWSWLFTHVGKPLFLALASGIHDPALWVVRHPTATGIAFLVVVGFMACFRVKTGQLLEVSPTEADRQTLRRWNARLEGTLCLTIMLGILGGLMVADAVEVDDYRVQVLQRAEAPLADAAKALPGGSFDDRWQWADGQFYGGHLTGDAQRERVQLIPRSLSVKTCVAMLEAVSHSTVWRVRSINGVEPQGAMSPDQCTGVWFNTLVLETLNRPF